MLVSRSAWHFTERLLWFPSNASNLPKESILLIAENKLVRWICLYQLSVGLQFMFQSLLLDLRGHWPVYVAGSRGLTGCTYESSCVITTIYPARSSARVLRSRPHSSCCTDAPWNRRLFFCERMTPSFAPDSCAGSLFVLSWVVLIKLCCRSSERRLMDAQEVWQLWEDAGQSGPAAICSLSFTALLMEKQTKQHGSEPCRQTNTHTRTHLQRARLNTKKRVGLSARTPVCGGGGGVGGGAFYLSAI